MQCHVDEGDVSTLQRELEDVGSAIDGGEIDSAVVRLAALLEHPVFRTRAGQPAVAAPSGSRALLDWWERGGESWVRSRLSNAPDFVEQPPTPRSVIDPTAVPMSILCERAGCDPLALSFVDSVVEGYEPPRPCPTTTADYRFPSSK